MSVPVSQSITRKSASNLALAFILLPRDRRQAMAALYAFCRRVDDVADEASIPLERRRDALEAWRRDLDAAYEGRPPTEPVMGELAPVIHRYKLPREPFDELLRGVEMDLDQQTYATQEDLEVYCYRVASVVGLLSIEIFGYRNPACQRYAVHLGKALQMTNILRDVGVDADRGRIYLPRADLTRFRVPPEEILGHRYSDRFCDLAAAFAARARESYAQARRSLPPEDQESMVAAELMGSVYWCLLTQLQKQQYDVLTGPPIRLGRAWKAWLILRTWWWIRLAGRRPVYGES